MQGGQIGDADEEGPTDFQHSTRLVKSPKDLFQVFECLIRDNNIDAFCREWYLVTFNVYVIRAYLSRAKVLGIRAMTLNCVKGGARFDCSCCKEVMSYSRSDIKDGRKRHGCSQKTAYHV